MVKWLIQSWFTAPKVRQLLPNTCRGMPSQHKLEEAVMYIQTTSPDSQTLGLSTHFTVALYMNNEHYFGRKFDFESLVFVMICVYP